MEYMRGWRALFGDPAWKGKLGISSLLIFTSAYCIPLVGQIVLYGYLALATRRAVQGQDTPLPRLDFNFDYLAKLIGIGFKPMVARFAYGMLVLPFVLPLMMVAMIGPAIARSGGDDGAIVMMVVTLISFAIYMLGIFFVSAIVHIAEMRASLMDDLGAALKPKAVFGMTKMLLKELIVGSLVIGIITIPMILLGLVFFYVGVFVAVAITFHIRAYYGAELYKRYLEKGGEPLPIGAVEVPGFEAAPSAPM